MISKILLDVFSAKPYDKKYLKQTINKLKESSSFFESVDVQFHNVNLNEQTQALIQSQQIQQNQQQQNQDKNNEQTKSKDTFRAVSCFVNDVCNGSVLEQLHKKDVKLILLRCAGFNNVDIDTAKKYGISVVRVPKYSPYATAEHSVTLMTALNRHIHKAYNRVRENNFSINGLIGFDMHQKTVGVIGTGNIGTIVCRILKLGFQCNVIAYDVYESDTVKSMGVKYVSLDELLHKSDIITLHCPLIEGKTEHMINKDSITKMKDGVMLINASRGKLIDTKAIIDGLKSKKIGALGLDVYENERDLFYENRASDMVEDDVFSRLLTFPNVIVTSHQAFFTKEAMDAISTTTLSSLKHIVEGTMKEDDEAVVHLNK